MMWRWKICRVLAGFCLAFFVYGCGQPHYRLEGQIRVEAAKVTLLDSLALAVLDSAFHAYKQEVRLLDERKVTVLDSVEKSTSELNGPIVVANKQYQTARAKYRGVFLRLHRFQSFGGNPIFIEEDASVSTQKLLAEIADRFYKGRAFSLETEGQIRRYIRQNLVPLERDMKQKQTRLRRLKNSKSGQSKGRDRLVVVFDEMRKVLVDTINKRILRTLLRHEVMQTQVDS
ncbi:MAG: hypothetical protein QGG64_14030, partial [Candidatus Latescibacteria bacterium]|nr:hypothetical protein [Candidatus Latescibacterota bacterium]